jgi:hypothetical protein
MASLNEHFDQLWHLIRHGRGLSNTGDDPVYYLVFHPEEMLDAKRHMKEWAAKLKIQGWTMETFSMAEAIKTIFDTNEFRDLWLASDDDKSFEPEAVQRINQTLADVLTSNDALKNALLSRLESLSGRKNTVLFVTDLEALHPYLRVGALEQRLQGRFCVPTVFLYPGFRDGKTTLKFLGIYPPDGNYRSVHVGG